MTRLSASSLNNLCKCELAFHLSKTPEAKKLKEEMGKKFALCFGTLVHHAVQEYDTDRFIKKINIDESREGILDRYMGSWVYFFSDEKSMKKQKITKEESEFAINTLLPKMRAWVTSESVKNQAIILNDIKAYQDRLSFKFTSKKPLSWYFEHGLEVLTNYINDKALDALGELVSITIEKRYDLKYDVDDMNGFVDERRVYLKNDKKKCYLIELKTSATEYTPEDCQIDNQMGLYPFYESIEGEFELEDIYSVMVHLASGVCTITQRTEQNLDYLLRRMEENFKRVDQMNKGEAEPLAKCGTNSFEHSKLMCDYKAICPVWKQIESQPTPIVLNKKEVKKKK